MADSTYRDKNEPTVDQPDSKRELNEALVDDTKRALKVTFGQVKENFLEDLRAHDYNVYDYDSFEAMLFSRTYDTVSKETSNGITDGNTTTIYLERSARVVGQLPSGVMKAYGKKDEGKAAFMDIIRQKWIYPNANAQQPFLNKIRMWQFYSSVYGWMPMFYDWHVNRITGYVGPDCWVWNPRNFIPQNGRTFVEDMDYCHAIAFVGIDYLESLLEEPEDSGWDRNAIMEVITSARNMTRFPDSKRDTYIRRQRTSQAAKNMIPLATRYEAGPDGYWRTFVWWFGFKMLREIPNPHKNNKIPFVIKYCIPLFDSFYGLGDFQRARPIQFAKDGLTNFYFEGIRQSIYPPTIINPSGVVRHTIDLRAGSVWEEIVPNSIRRLDAAPGGLNTYESAMTQLNGSLLNQAGTTDTVANQQNALDPAMGKTPDAIQNLQQRESTRDNQDRFYLEQSLECLINNMIELIPNIGTETVPVDLWADEAKMIVDSGYPDILEMLEISQSGQSARLSIKPKSLKGVQYKFYLEEGSTAKADKQAQLQSVQNFLQFLAQNQNVVQQLNEMGQTIDLTVVAQLYGSLTDVPELNKIIRPMNQQEQQSFQQAAQPQGKPPQERIDYKDAPPMIQAQMEQQAGFQPDPSHTQGLAHPINPAGIGGGQPQFQDSTIAQAADKIRSMAR